MFTSLINIYDALILRRPKLSLTLVALLVMLSVTQLSKIKLDASADSLLLQGDPALDFFREVSNSYSTEEFLIITWQPYAELLSDASLNPLRQMADELRVLSGVSSVTTVWDVPLLESPPVTLGDITSNDPLPSLDTPGLDRTLALAEFTTSPIYSSLLVSEDGSVTAVQINLQRDDRYTELLNTREALRAQRSKTSLSAEADAQLAAVEAEFKILAAEVQDRQGQLVSDVRAVAASYKEHGKLFVGGVPMIAADMVAFVQSDLVLFGTAILGIMLVVLALIFRRVRWVVIPLITCSSSVLVMLGLLAVLDWRMTVISSNFVAVLLIITLAICIHLIVRYRELDAADPGGDLHPRVLETVRLMVVPCFYTGVTTIVAFVSLVVSGIQPVIDFGWMMTVGICVALLLSFVLVPCLMLVWPKGRPFVYAVTSEAMTMRFARMADRFGNTIIVFCLVLSTGIVWGVSRLKVENRFIDYFHESTEIYRGMELLDSKLGGTIPLDIVLAPPNRDKPLPGLEKPASAAALIPAAQDDPFLEEEDFFSADIQQPAVPAHGGEVFDEFAGEFEDEFSDDFDEFSAPSDDTFVPSYWFSLEGMRVLDAVHHYVDSRPETGKVLSLSTTFSVVKDLLGDDIGSVELALVQKSLPPDIKGLMVNPYFAEDIEQARVSVRVMETSEDLRRNEFLNELRRDLIEQVGLAPEQVQFTGMLVLYNNVLQSLFRSQILTLGAVFIAILIMLWLLFRSFSLALIGLAPNVLAAGLVLGVMGAVGIPLDIMTITIAAIVVGIGVDNCIHYVHRYQREFPQDRDYKATMYRCHASIGRALYYTTMTVVIGFSMLTLSNFNPSIYFGLLTVLAMIAAVLGALLLLPRLIILFRPLGPEG
ncbi:MAG: putative RND superfamily exporter protein [Halieaceae bacterium]|jgi:predicted RND superfamily exporter protein